MAIYHLSIKIIGRNAGRSAVAAAAYRSGDILTNQWDGLTHNYSKKGWIKHTEIMLPEHAPETFSDRSTLWNAVESAEKSSDAQLAREVEIALPIELTLEQQTALIRDYIQKNFVSKGMCADFAIHSPPVTDDRHRPIDASGNPTKDTEKMTFRNPHAHIMLTMRPLNEQGQWQPKSQKAYVCRKGNQEKVIPASEFEEAEKDGWQKQYQYKVGKKKIWLTAEAAAKKDLKRINKNPKSQKIQNSVTAEWNDKNSLIRWRESWASMCNEALQKYGIDARIDHRSYEEQCINQIGSVHLGADAFHAEKKGIHTELGDLNRQIKADNDFLKKFEKQIEELERKETERIRRTVSKMEGLRASNIISTYQQLALSASVESEKESMWKQMEIQKALAKSAEQMLTGIESLTNVIALMQRELERTNPLQMQKRKEIKQSIIETEGQLQELKNKLDEIQEQRQKLKVTPASNLAVLEQKQKQIQHLKEIQSQTYKEFYTLVRENKENMEQIKAIIQGKRPEYDRQIESRLREHYEDKFQGKILEQARAKAPDIVESEAAGIQRAISHRR